MPDSARASQWRLTKKPVHSGDEPETKVITAAYVVSDDNQPGWTLFKSADHKIVYHVRSDQAIDIERVDRT